MATSICKLCGKGYKTSHPKKQKYCSTECYIKSDNFALKKLAPWNKGKTGVYSEATLKSKSDKLKGRPTWMKGKKHRPESNIKRSLAQSGSKHYNWQGGKSFEPYTIDWTNTLKKSIRERDKYTCQICGKEPATDVHHKDYNKENCDPKNLITLCHECHPKTNFNKNYWIKLWN